MRTWGEWKDVSPGSLQADLVLHCGETTAGFYLTTLCAVDVACGWTELEPIWGLGKQRAGTGVHHIRQRLPFALRSLHTGYDEPRTAYQRLIESNVLSQAEHRRLEEKLHTTNPADLRRRIDALLRQLWKLAQKEDPTADAVG